MSDNNKTETATGGTINGRPAAEFTGQKPNATVAVEFTPKEARLIERYLTSIRLCDVKHEADLAPLYHAGLAMRREITRALD